MNGHKISEAKSTCDPVLAAEFHPIEKNLLITIGKGHIHFWDIEGGSLAKKIGSFEVWGFVVVVCVIELGYHFACS